MNTVLSVDLKAFAIGVLDNFVNARGTVALRWLVVHRQILREWNSRVFESQVAGLVFFMIRVRQEHRTQTIEAQGIIWLGIGDFLALCRRLERCVIRRRVVDRKREFAAEDGLINPNERGSNQTAKLVHKPAKVARRIQLFM